MSKPPTTQQPGASRPRTAPKPTPSHRCDCGRQFSSTSALASHRKASSAHKGDNSKTDGKNGSNKDAGTRKPRSNEQASNHICDCGKGFGDEWLLRRHRRTAKEHALPKPFANKASMVLMRPVGEAKAAGLGEALERQGMITRWEVGTEKETCLLCQCGCFFGGWAEVYGHLKVHKAGSEVTVYTGEVWRKVGWSEGETGQKNGDADSGSGVRCSCGRTFKHAGAMDQHKRDSPLHKPDEGATNSHVTSLPSTASSSGGAGDAHSTREKLIPSSSTSIADRTQSSSEVTNERLESTSEKQQDTSSTTCTCGKSFKHGNALAQHQRDSPKHNKPAQAQTGPSTTSSAGKKHKKKTGSQRGYEGGSGGGGQGNEYYYMGGGGSQDNGYYYIADGGGYDWGLCDKDCGWCGHCMDNVDI